MYDAAVVYNNKKDSLYNSIGSVAFRLKKTKG
jgi:hypothetical protein